MWTDYETIISNIDDKYTLGYDTDITDEVSNADKKLLTNDENLIELNVKLEYTAEQKQSYTDPHIDEIWEILKVESVLSDSVNECICTYLSENENEMYNITEGIDRKSVV